MFALVVTSAKSSAIGNGLTYDCGELKVQPGALVRVPLRNQLVEGVVVDVMTSLPSGVTDTKTIAAIIEPNFLSKEHIQTAKALAFDCYCTLRQAFGLWLGPSKWAALLPKKDVVYELADANATPKGEKQKKILDALRAQPQSASQLKERTGATSAALKSLEEKGWIAESRNEPVASTIMAFMTGIELTDEQKLAVETIKAAQRPTLLFGVTGSGKTEVYAYLIERAVQEGKTALLLVPEIFLSQHLVERFSTLFPPSLLAVFHSRQSAAEEKESWRRIWSGQARIVIGPRSALFTPLKNIGVIVLDEEQEWTYKNEQTPRYHARTVAEHLAKASNAILVCGSATPSVETWAKVEAKTYAIATLNARFGNAELPKVHIVDLAQANFGSLYPFTTTLIEAMKKRLSKKEQVVLLLNRRGVATALLCLDCRRRICSPVTKMPLTVHHDRGSAYLHDHATDLRIALPTICPHCGSPRLHEVGAGTQKIEQQLKELFPHARVLRVDSDSLEKPEDMRAVLNDMRQGKADILLGTQSVAKGLDLPGVTLAAVLVADVGLSLPHFRAGERVFHLLSQLTGRSGRHQPGEVIIQTFRPEAPEILFASSHNPSGFLDTELLMRRALEYPPAIPMVRFLMRGEKPDVQAMHVLAELQKIASEIDPSAKMSAGPTFFSGGREWHVLLRSTHIRSFIERISREDVVIDPDPLETL